MSQKATITIEITCTAPKGFFEPLWDDIPEEYKTMLEERGPIPCEGAGISLLCTERCPWAEWDDCDSVSLYVPEGVGEQGSDPPEAPTTLLLQPDEPSSKRTDQNPAPRPLLEEKYDS